MEEGPIFHIQASAMLEDLSKLITWAHSHGSICPQNMLWHEGTINSLGHQSKGMTWRCEVGHSYDWSFSLATGVKDEEDNEEVVGQRSKRRKTQHLSLCEEKTDCSFIKNTTDENWVESDVSHCSLVTHVSGEGAPVRKPVKALTGNKNTRMQKQQGNVKQLFFPRVIAQEDPESNINMKRGMKKEEIFQESKTEETGIEKRTFQKEENPCPNENLIAALDINPILRCISDMESTLDDQWLTSPHKQGSPSPHKSNHLYQGQGEPHKQESCSAVLFPSTTQKPNAAVAYFATDKGKVKATPKKPADKRVTNKGEAYLGNIMTFVAWLNSQNHPRANCAGSLPVAELDKLLVAFFQYVWETSHLEALSSSTFTTYVRVLDHDLQNQGCRFSIRKSAEFPNTVRKLYSCCQHFKQREWDRDILVIQSLRKEEEAKLRRRGILSRATPDGLFNLVLLNNIRAFGKFHLQGVWPVRTADFQMTTENHPGTGNGEELEYLEWNNTNIPDQCVVRLHGLADNPEQCPLQDYKLYESKKAGSHRVGTEPMYCCPLSQCSVWDDYWFSRQAISKLRLAKIIKVLSYHILSVRNGKSAAVY